MLLLEKNFKYMTRVLNQDAQQLLSKILQFIGNTIENVVSHYPLVLEAMKTKSVNIFN